VRYAFVAEHRPVFPVRAMCRCLRIHPSGFYAWLRNPLSKRAREDARQTELIRKAWKESGKVYGYRKLHDDLLDQGETCCPNRVARLARQADIKAQIGYRRRPGVYGGKPSVVVDNTLDRQFDVEDPDKVWVTDITYIRTLEGFAWECHELCVSGLAHAGFRYGHALKRSSNMVANWFRAANHSLTFLPPFSKFRIAR
jgi:putative transposase